MLGILKVHSFVLRLLTVELLLLHWWRQSHLLLLTGWLSIIILSGAVLLLHWLLVVLINRNLVVTVWLLLNRFALGSWGNLIPNVLSWLLLLLNYYFWSNYWFFLQLAQNGLLNCRLRIWNWHRLPRHFWQQLNRLIKPFRLLHRFVHTSCRFLRFLLWLCCCWLVRPIVVSSLCDLECIASLAVICPQPSTKSVHNLTFKPLKNPYTPFRQLNQPIRRQFV